MAYTKCMITCMLHFRESYPESCPRIIPANHTTNHTHDFNNIPETYPETYPRNIPPKHTSNHTPWCNTLCWARSFRKRPYIIYILYIYIYVWDFITCWSLFAIFCFVRLMSSSKILGEESTQPRSDMLRISYWLTGFWQVLHLAQFWNFGALFFTTFPSNGASTPCFACAVLGDGSDNEEETCLATIFWFYLES